MLELASKVPVLAAKCMAVKGLRFKTIWEAWSPSEVSLQKGHDWTFDVKKPNEDLSGQRMRADR